MCTFMLQSYCKLSFSASNEIPYAEGRGGKDAEAGGYPTVSPVDWHKVYFPVVMKGRGLFCQKVLMTCVMSGRTTHVLSPWLSEARVGVCTARARLCLVWKNRGVCGLALKGFFHIFKGVCVWGGVVGCVQNVALNLEGTLEGHLCWT